MAKHVRISLLRPAGQAGAAHCQPCIRFADALIRSAREVVYETEEIKLNKIIDRNHRILIILNFKLLLNSVGESHVWRS
ncbi:hypothetical protein COCON_G00137490 [Conger conger]|uniref:Uncharacterized protein n=1 Tax=Conger conger TaxID=82655 RepID=A0A9Q1DF21_CONCO|nr:hypothetical protein COCON_G00137490 [Conger conger]